MVFLFAALAFFVAVVLTVLLFFLKFHYRCLICVFFMLCVCVFSRFAIFAVLVIVPVPVVFVAVAVVVVAGVVVVAVAAAVVVAAAAAVVVPVAVFVAVAAVVVGCFCCCHLVSPTPFFGTNCRAESCFKASSLCGLHFLF